MTSLAELVDASDGFATTRELLTAGASERMLTWAVRTGELIRARNGWYTTRPLRDPAVQAVRVGGRLTGVSALAAWGCWMWDPPTQLHVAVPRNASRLRQPRRRRPLGRRFAGLVVHWEATDRESEQVWAVSLHDALVRVVLDEPLERAVAAFDWAIRTGRLDEIGLDEVIAALPEPARCIRAWIDGRSDSILETESRIRFRRNGYRVESQVELFERKAPVDLVVEGIVAVECDGRAFHADSFTSDRRKDLEIATAGRHALRIDAHLLRDEWSRVLSAVFAAIVARRPDFVVGNSGVVPRIPHGCRRTSRRRSAGPEFPTGAPRGIEGGAEHPASATAVPAIGTHRERHRPTLRTRENGSSIGRNSLDAYLSP